MFQKLGRFKSAMNGQMSNPMRDVQSSFKNIARCNGGDVAERDASAYQTRDHYS